MRNTYSRRRTGPSSRTHDRSDRVHMTDRMEQLSVKGGKSMQPGVDDKVIGWLVADKRNPPDGFQNNDINNNYQRQRIVITGTKNQRSTGPQTCGKGVCEKRDPPPIKQDSLSQSSQSGFKNLMPPDWLR
ncbi:unnamed protein product [Protopolystoma xenopodis]|uniref:Uncharacterized protein n=1 Tax=Protopolystoma xenopodis TaxID=117903 RepID=A0A448XK62_9PLAT|nr:unnamed protein product [Protopolystoma xenopodis]